MFRRLLLAFTIGAAALFLAAPAFADPTPAPPVECSDPGFNCTYDGTQWNVDAPTGSVGNPFPDPTDNGPSPGTLFGAFAVLAIVLGGGTFLWRISTARRIAEQAGLDPDTAASTAILSDDGLAATYLAANLRPQPGPVDQPTVRHGGPAVRSTEDRLGELKHLHDEGLVTDDEYARRRTAIVDSI